MLSGPQCYRPKSYARSFTSVFTYMAPQEGFEPLSDTLEECCLVQLDHCGRFLKADYFSGLESKDIKSKISP